MKNLILAALAGLLLSPTATFAEAPKRSVLDNEPELFAVVTPDRLLGRHTRRQWLTLWPGNGREYWAAWDCKGKPCDTPKRAHIRATAKLIPRTDKDPKPLAPDTPPQSWQ
ncbi:MAG TPA: hypothetical protein VN112_05580 [Ensifer sp.]|nr:hypothetical protein [Ensifer sp.]